MYSKIAFSIGYCPGLAHAFLSPVLTLYDQRASELQLAHALILI